MAENPAVEIETEMVRSSPPQLSPKLKPIEPVTLAWRLSESTIARSRRTSSSFSDTISACARSAVTRPSAR